MLKVVTKIVSFILLAALLVSPVAAAALERVLPPTDAPEISAEEQNWLDAAAKAESFTVQLDEPSLATYEGENALFAAVPRNGSGKIEVNSPEATSYLKHINANLDAFIAKAESLLGRDLELLFRYDYVLNGFSAKMTLDEAALLRKQPSTKPRCCANNPASAKSSWMTYITWTPMSARNSSALTTFGTAVPFHPEQALKALARSSVS